MTAIGKLLRPRSVAVVGASADPSRMTGRPVGYLQRHGFTGAIYPVNPRAGEIAGLRCYPDVASLPEAPDAASSCSVRSGSSRRCGRWPSAARRPRSSWPAASRKAAPRAARGSRR